MGSNLLPADDNPSEAFLVGKALDVVGGSWKLTRATSGQQVLDRLRAELPDAVLMDPEMSDGEGFETLREIRRLGDSPPVLIWTMRSGYERRCRESGASDDVSKLGSARSLRSLWGEFSRSTAR